MPAASLTWLRRCVARCPSHRPGPILSSHASAGARQPMPRAVADCSCANFIREPTCPRDATDAGTPHAPHPTEPHATPPRTRPCGMNAAKLISNDTCALPSLLDGAHAQIQQAKGRGGGVVAATSQQQQQQEATQQPTRSRRSGPRRVVPTAEPTSTVPALAMVLLPLVLAVAPPAAEGTTVRLRRPMA